jgi:hypothetical protein
MTARDPLKCTLAKLNAPGLLGFLVQCGRCPQQALLDAQPDGEWTCPRCAEVAEPVGTIRSGLTHDIVSHISLPRDHWMIFCNCGEIMFGASEDIAHREWREHRARKLAPADDDEYPLGKVRG